MDIDKIINSYQLKVNAEDAKPENVAQAKDETLNKVKNVSVLAGLFDNIRTAYEMVSDSVTGKYKGVSKGTRALLAGGLAYLALPIDLVPDFIPGIGFLDDALVIGLAIKLAQPDLEKYRAWKTSREEKAA